MKAVVIKDVTPAENIKLSEIPVPKVKSGWVLVKIKAFGLNHSEQILRINEIKADYIQKPIVPGIECVGMVEDPSDSSFKKGQKVIAMMGGMGRSFNGSYSEYALLPENHIFNVSCKLSWAELGAVPETYFTAWGSLVECLNIKADDVLLIRGATCALGYAAIQIAKKIGCYVIATTHRESKLCFLEEADEAILDMRQLAGRMKNVNKVLDLIGPKYLKDTLYSIEQRGIVCSTGVLGGVYALNGFDTIKDIPNGVYLTSFFSNYPNQETVDKIFTFIEEHKINPHIGAVYKFNDIARACEDMDNGRVNGKIVVKV